MIVDIIVQKKVIINNIITFEELYHPVGGNYGSNRINELFMERVNIYYNNNNNLIKKIEFVI